MSGPNSIEHVELEAGEWLLRPPRPEDATDALTLVSDPDVVQWNPIGPAKPLPDAPAVERWLARAADWSAGDHVSFAVVESATGRLAGSVSLHRIDREQSGASIGYRVAPWARGRGAATAAVAAVTDWAFAGLGLARVELCHAVVNPASCRVALKAGYPIEGTLRAAFVYGDGKRYDEHIHGRLASDG